MASGYFNASGGNVVFLILININNKSLKNQDFILNLLFCPGESRIVFFIWLILSIYTCSAPVLLS